jgi:hypothetical protein
MQRYGILSLYGDAQQQQPGTSEAQSLEDHSSAPAPLAD